MYLTVKANTEKNTLKIGYKYFKYIEIFLKNDNIHSETKSK